MGEEEPNAPRDAKSGPMTRRAVVKASLGLGFCAAIAPAWAQTITTPAEGLDVGEARVEAGDELIDRVGGLLNVPEERANVTRHRPTRAPYRC